MCHVLIRNQLPSASTHFNQADVLGLENDPQRKKVSTIYKTAFYSIEDNAGGRKYFLESLYAHFFLKELGKVDDLKTTS